MFDSSPQNRAKSIVLYVLIPAICMWCILHILSYLCRIYKQRQRQ